MKKIIVIVFVILMTSTSVIATEYSNQLPLGKNYLDVENFWNREGELKSYDTIKVLPNTRYVISVPGESNLPNMEIYVSGLVDYVDGDVTAQDNCTVGDSRTYCTFTTSVNETGLDIDFYAYYMDFYFDNSGIQGFQLETGSSPTSYASYISPGEDSNPPVISGQGAYFTDYDAPETIQSIVSNHFTAYDVIDGDISDHINVVVDDYSGNETTVGFYDVTLEVKDTAQNTTTYEFTVVVGDRRDPVITGPDTIYLDLTDDISVREIIEEEFDIVDEYDGVITSFTMLEDEYTNNVGIPGKYDVGFRAKDSSGNAQQASFYIVIEDLDGPVYTGDAQFISLLSDPIFTEDIISVLEFSDNFSSYENIATEILTNELKDNETTVGTYLIEVRLTDEQNNHTVVEIEIDVQDDIFPTFIGPNKVEKSYTDPFTVDDIMALFRVQDNIDELDETNIVLSNENYLLNSSVVGSYEVELEVSDQAGNVTTHRLTIDVIDDVAPIISGDEFLVTLNTKMNFNEEDALLLLINNGSLLNQDYKITTLINEYTGNEEVPGYYKYSILLDGEDGTQFEKDFMIQVQEESTDIETEVPIIRTISIYTTIIGLIGFVIFKTIKK